MGAEPIVMGQPWNWSRSSTRAARCSAGDPGRDAGGQPAPPLRRYRRAATATGRSSCTVGPTGRTCGRAGGTSPSAASPRSASLPRPPSGSWPRRPASTAAADAAAGRRRLPRRRRGRRPFIFELEHPGPFTFADGEVEVAWVPLASLDAWLGRHETCPDPSRWWRRTRSPDRRPVRLPPMTVEERIADTVATHVARVGERATRSSRMPSSRNWSTRSVHAFDELHTELDVEDRVRQRLEGRETFRVYDLLAHGEVFAGYRSIPRYPRGRGRPRPRLPDLVAQVHRHLTSNRPRSRSMPTTC